MKGHKKNLNLKELYKRIKSRVAFQTQKNKGYRVIKNSVTFVFSLVQLRGLEPLPTLSGLEPESSAYANSATTAKPTYLFYYFLSKSQAKNTSFFKKLKIIE